MANLIVRAGATYLNDQKVAEASDAEMTLNPRRQDMFGAEGWMGLTRGATTMDVRVTLLIPVSGTQPDFINDLVNQNDVELAMVIDGRVFRITGGYTQGTMKYNTETGRCDGTFAINGGPPQITDLLA
jgi:hypothetical protein